MRSTALKLIDAEPCSEAAPALTPKQEKFVTVYLETGNASEAYRQAYDASAMTAQCIHVKASELLAHGKVAVRLAESRAANAAYCSVTVDRITSMLIASYDKAMSEAKGASAAVSAATALAKLHGLMTDKVETRSTVAGIMAVTVDRPGRETRTEWLARTDENRARALELIDKLGLVPTAERPEDEFPIFARLSAH